MKGWNKQFDEPESFVGILTVHLQVGKLPETSELIFLGGLCRSFCLFWILLQKNNMFIYVSYNHLCKNEKCKAVHKKQLNAARCKSVSKCFETVNR